MSNPRATAARIAWHLNGNPAALVDRLCKLLERAEWDRPGVVEAMDRAAREEA